MRSRWGFPAPSRRHGGLDADDGGAAVHVQLSEHNVELRWALDQMQRDKKQADEERQSHAAHEAQNSRQVVLQAKADIEIHRQEVRALRTCGCSGCSGCSAPSGGI